VHAENFDRYKEDESVFAHEAGFDAFMTGAAYLRIMYQLNGNQKKQTALNQKLIFN